MALLSVIRRWHFRDHISIREICRRTGLSRNTIRKYLRLDGVEPRFKVPEGPRRFACSTTAAGSVECLADLWVAMSAVMVLQVSPPISTDAPTRPRRARGEDRDRGAGCRGRS